MDIWSLLLVSLQSSTQVLLTCLIGYFCARTGVISLSAQKGLSNLVIKVLTPCLLFSQVAADINASKLLRLWPIPTFFTLFAVISACLGLYGGKFLRLSVSNTKFMMTGIIFNNVTSLCVALLQALASTSAVEIFKNDPNDTAATVMARGISYILLANLLGNLIRWTLGVYLLKKNSDEVSDEVVEDSQSSTEDDERTRILPTHSTPIYTSIPTPSDSVENISCGRDCIDILTSLPHAIHSVMNPPLYAAIAALVVGTNPALKGLFFDKNSPVYPTFTKTTEHLGKATIPLTLLVLGAQLRNIPRAKGQEMIPMTIYVMACRFIIMPIIGVSLVLATYQYFLEDRMLWFVLMLLAGGPTAVNCMNIAQLTGTFQGEMATLLFYSYTALAPILTITLVGMLTVLQSMGST